MNYRVELIAVLVDNANIFFNIKNLGIRIDYNRLERLIEKKMDETVIAKIMYVGVNKKPSKRQLAFITSMESQGWYIEKTPLVSQKGKRKQKRVDIKIYKHGVELARQNMVDKIVLVSGDADFVELVISLKELGKKIEVYSFRKSLAKALIQEVGIENIHYLDDILEDIAY